jgi:hypothetical protein
VTLPRGRLAGMLEHCDFEQVSVEGDNGRLRPDMVIHCRRPGHRGGLEGAAGH